jgi:Flp pilus assembly protein TadG
MDRGVVAASASVMPPGGSVRDPRSSRGRCDSGAAAVEFSLVALILFTLIFGIIAFGFALFNQQGAVQAARESARKASIGVSDGASCQAALRFGRDAAGAAKSTFTSMQLSITNNAYRQPVNVTVNYDVNLSMVGWLPGVPTTLSLHQTAKASIEVGNAGFSGCSIGPPSW